MSRIWLRFHSREDFFGWQQERASPIGTGPSQTRNCASTSRITACARPRRRLDSRIAGHRPFCASPGVINSCYPSHAMTRNDRTSVFPILAPHLSPRCPLPPERPHTAGVSASCFEEVARSARPRCPYALSGALRKLELQSCDICESERDPNHTSRITWPSTHHWKKS